MGGLEVGSLGRVLVAGGTIGGGAGRWMVRLEEGAFGGGEGRDDVCVCVCVYVCVCVCV